MNILKKIQLERWFRSKIPADRAKAASQGYKLEQLTYDPHAFVRMAVAKQGHALDVLVNDPDYRVRCEVAYHGYDLEKLLQDEHPSVRDTAKMIVN